MRIIGIDPGSRVTGFGVMELQGSVMRYLASGCIRGRGDTYFTRVREIYCGIEEVISHYQPDVVILERVFLARNPDSALKLGQVRGLVMSILFQQEIRMFEYAAKEVKQCVTGKGNAAKQQVQYMVQRLLNLSEQPAEDAADALALAICHIYKGAPES